MRDTMAKGKKTGGRRRGSGNKVAHPVKELAQKHGAGAIETLRELMTDEGQPGAVRVSAANSILDRGYGKPPQSVLDAGEPLEFPSIKVQFVNPARNFDDVGDIPEKLS